MKKIINNTIIGISSIGLAYMYVLFELWVVDQICGDVVRVTDMTTGMSYLTTVRNGNINDLMSILTVASIMLLAFVVCNQIRKDLNERSNEEA